jgi:hypothetical protein
MKGKKVTENQKITDNEKPKVELIEEALLKNVAGACQDNCGDDAGNGCWHDKCYDCSKPSFGP